jgi:hypothetical protein
MKRRIATFLVAVGSLVGAAALWRKRSSSGKERVDLYFADGSMVSFAETTEEAARLFPFARRILAQARS